MEKHRKKVMQVDKESRRNKLSTRRYSNDGGRLEAIGECNKKNA